MYIKLNVKFNILYKQFKFKANMNFAVFSSLQMRQNSLRPVKTKLKNIFHKMSMRRETSVKTTTINVAVIQFHYYVTTVYDRQLSGKGKENKVLTLCTLVVFLLTNLNNKL